MSKRKYDESGLGDVGDVTHCAGTEAANQMTGGGGGDENSDCADDSSSSSGSSSAQTDGSTDVVRQSCSALKKAKKSVSFDGVTVYYFQRKQGFTCVPSQGGSTLGMDEVHVGTEKFTVREYSVAQHRQHKAILLEQHRQGKLILPADHLMAPLTDSDSDDASRSLTGVVDDYYFLQPVTTRQRRLLLRAAGVAKIDNVEKDDCRAIRMSRESCGCSCQVRCDPATCPCALANIPCQVDRLSFPCGCTREACANVSGRVEFNPARVRTHFAHTLNRLSSEVVPMCARRNVSDSGATTFNSTERGSCRDCQHTDFLRDLPILPAIPTTANAAMVDSLQMEQDAMYEFVKEDSSYSESSECSNDSTACSTTQESDSATRTGFGSCDLSARFGVTCEQVSNGTEVATRTSYMTVASDGARDFTPVQYNAIQSDSYTHTADGLKLEPICELLNPIRFPQGVYSTDDEHPTWSTECYPYPPPTAAAAVSGDAASESTNFTYHNGSPKLVTSSMYDNCKDTSSTSEQQFSASISNVSDNTYDGSYVASQNSWPHVDKGSYTAIREYSEKNMYPTSEEFADKDTYDISQQYTTNQDYAEKESYTSSEQYAATISRPPYDTENVAYSADDSYNGAKDDAGFIGRQDYDAESNNLSAVSQNSYTASLQYDDTPYRASEYLLENMDGVSRNGVDASSHFSTDAGNKQQTYMSEVASSSTISLPAAPPRYHQLVSPGSDFVATALPKTAPSLLAVSFCLNAGDKPIDDHLFTTDPIQPVSLVSSSCDDAIVTESVVCKQTAVCPTSPDSSTQQNFGEIIKESIVKTVSA